MFHAVTIEHLGFPCSSAGRESACNAGDLGSIPESGNSPREGIVYPLLYSWASLVAQMVKNPPAMWETWVPSLGWEDMLEEGIATHSSILAWRIPMGRGAWLATVHGVAKRSQRVGHDWATKHIEHLVLGRPLHQIMGEEITQLVTLPRYEIILSFLGYPENVLSTVLTGNWAQRSRDSVAKLSKLMCTFNKHLRLLVNRTFGQQLLGIRRRWGHLSFPHIFLKKWQAKMKVSL